MLIFLVHETGHHLQYDLSAGLTKRYREHLGALATTAGGTTEQVKQWKSWSNEVFADVFALMAAGGEVARGLDELQLSGPVGTVTSQYGYPPPIVRAALGSAVLQFAAEPARPLAQDSGRLQALHALALPAKEEALRTRAEDHLRLLPKLVPGLVDGALTPPECDEPMPNLRTIGGWDSTYFERDGDVQIWCERLLGTGQAIAARARPAARLCAAGAVAAWSTLAMTKDAKLEAEEERLRERIVAELKLCHEETDRAGPVTPRRISHLRDDLITTLRRTDPDALM